VAAATAWFEPLNYAMNLNYMCSASRTSGISTDRRAGTLLVDKIKETFRELVMNEFLTKRDEDEAYEALFGDESESERDDRGSASIYLISLPDAEEFWKKMGFEENGDHFVWRTDLD
jgi:hypothetical protein